MAALCRKVYASISRPNVSIAPLMYNAAFRELGLDFVYVSFEVSDLAGAVHAMRALGICGYSVSLPFKREVISLIDELDPAARAVGAVNIVKNLDGILVGYNSDWIGATRAIEKHATIAGKRAAVLGAGGAGRAIAFGLKTENATVSIYNRTQEHARAVAGELGVGYGGGLDDWDAIGQADIVINATPVGGWLKSPGFAVPAGLLREGQVVMDAVFQPVETDLLRQAKDAGCIVVHGFEMLLQQGAVTFELFTGHPAPAETMLDALTAFLMA
jgi:shikimate dehydrogenase